MSKVIELTYALNDIGSIAKEFIRQTKGYHIFAFSGELGAGKTTFISALCKELDVTDIVSSPTFAIVQEYHSKNNKNIYHIDMYRIKDEEDAIHSGLEEYITGNDYCFVEWPENASGIFPVQTVSVSLELIDTAKRKMRIELPK